MLEYQGGVDSISASLTAILRGVSSGSTVFARCSNWAIRQALMPGGPISRTVVVHSLERRTLAVILSSERLTDTASKPILRASTSIHSRVRSRYFRTQHQGAEP